jgi:apolipoprotein N-acyltransferase
MAFPPVKGSEASGRKFPRIRGWVRFWGRPLAAGLLLWAAFPPLRLPGTIFLAWLPLLSLIQEEMDTSLGERPRGVAWSLWLAGVFFAWGLLFWILALSNEQVTIPGLMIPCMVLIGAYFGLFFLILGSLLRWVGRGTGIPLGLLFPVFWTLVEWLRTIGPLGFPWGSPGYAFARTPAAVQFTAVTGFWGLNLWIGAVTGLLHEGLRWRIPSRRSLLLFGVALALLVLPPIQGRLRLGGAPSAEAALRGEGGVLVGIVQPNVIREVKWRPGGAQASWEKLKAGSRQVMGMGAELLVWPETALPMRLLHQPLYLQRVERLVGGGGVGLVVGTLYSEGAPETEDFVSHNSAFIMDASGEIHVLYHKQKLVPFSERMPLQKILPFLTQIDFGQSDFTPGKTFDTLPWDSLNLAPLICFESIFPEVSRSFARNGANALVNITNDFWFGDTPGPVQHAEMAILRTVETGLPLIRCANTGLSFFVDPYGRIVQSLGTFREGVLLAEVGPGKPSFSVRHGPWLLWILGAFGILLIATRFLRGRKLRHG